MRGRGNNNNNSNNGNRKSPNPLQRSYESNGPDVKVRGTAQNVAEKYLQLARDAQSSGDTVAAESYFQHAEHYYRILLAAQEQMTQQFGHTFPLNRAFVEDADEEEEGGEDDGQGFNPGDQRQPQQHDGMNGNAYHQGGQRQDGQGYRQDGPRQDGQGYRQDTRQDGPRQDGPRQDGPRDGDRQNRNDRNRRFDRQDRQGQGQDRFERGERRFDRNDNGQGGYAPRQDSQRPDLAGQDQPSETAAPVEGAQTQPEQRFERPERSPRRGRRERYENNAEANDDVGGLPSFLTSPLRVPITVAEERPQVEAPEPQASAEPAGAASEPHAAPAADDAGSEPAKRPRRRRSPREVMAALEAEDNASE